MFYRAITLTAGIVSEVIGITLLATSCCMPLAVIFLVLGLLYFYIVINS